MPINTHKFIVEQISQCTHFKKKIFSRYLSFVKSLVQNKKSSVKFLFNLVRQDVQSCTGSNLRCIYKNTGVFVIPGQTTKMALSSYTVFKIPPGEEWRVPLLSSLMQIREGE